MAEDPAPIEPVHLTPAASVSSRATTQSKVEVVMPKGKGKKCSHQDLGGDEVIPFPPQGMVIHPDPFVQSVSVSVSVQPSPGPVNNNEKNW
ncbi:hypothetical protein PAXRUDRAFT_16330 [Paxillus rubicundulus Ve08.2h10]|uniref:Uncharacterized protein n=1 Tax=Paxillus rubicundulus Ve08.2h10 TaxID=930991 RepID=A0A0D0CVJ8_9AGAM|nr:hypothetical protein PAXRUDRAFT_16330 [Paxillus rubicundulus Ve08.2h10]